MKVTQKVVTTTTKIIEMNEKLLSSILVDSLVSRGLLKKSDYVDIDFQTSQNCFSRVLISVTSRSEA